MGRSQRRGYGRGQAPLHQPVDHGADARADLQHVQGVGGGEAAYFLHKARPDDAIEGVVVHGAFGG